MSDSRETDMPSASASIDAKLDFLMQKACDLMSINVISQERMAKLEDRADSLETSISNLRSETKDSVDTIKAELRGEVFALRTELKDVKSTLNARDQKERSLNIKLAGLPVSDDELSAPDPDKFLAKRIYDRILLPILTKAKEASHLDVVPTLAKTIVSARRVNTWVNPNPDPIPGSAAAAKSKSKASAIPLIIVTFSSPTVRLAILRNKKSHTPSPTDVDKRLGSVGFFINEDLTSASFNLLRALQADDRVDKAWSLNGRLRFTRNGDKNRKIHKVASIFDLVNKILASTTSSS